MGRAAWTAIIGIAAAAVSAAQQQPTFRTATDLVAFSVIVTDKQGAPITGLTKDDFRVVEDGHDQAVQFFVAGQPDTAPPLHLGLLLDMSGSMADDLAAARSAAVKFVNAMTRAVDVTLVDFDTQVRVARFGLDDYPRLVERIRTGEAQGDTALFDALGVYLDGAGQQTGQKVLVLYTDGGDNGSALTYDGALDLLKASDVTVYAIGYLGHARHRGSLAERMELQRFAAITGGETYFPDGRTDLDAVFARIQREVASRYSLGYVSSDHRTDGAWRSVAITLRRPDLERARIRTRTGYFAPYKPGT
ncbi:MAG TPA: VWA domain-containing protein [Vicinamibacterales bacterium]|nr:VWA domain-containing protein [Vicinamibacterales bacterium]